MGFAVVDEYGWWRLYWFWCVVVVGDLVVCVFETEWVFGYRAVDHGQFFDQLVDVHVGAVVWYVCLFVVGDHLVGAEFDFDLIFGQHVYCGEFFG